MSGPISIAARTKGVISLVILILLLENSSVLGQTTRHIARVEEDWELVVDQPDPTNNGPQVTCAISPLNMRVCYAAFDINYHTQPDYYMGGLQLHVWDPFDPVVTRDFPAGDLLSTPGETIAWTQTMTLDSGRLTFQVINGRSQTWGMFGDAAQAITVRIPLWNLDGYDPRVSVNNSGVSFASNMVSSLTLKAIRCYDANGELIGQTTDPMPVYPKP